MSGFREGELYFFRLVGVVSINHYHKGGVH